MNNVIESCAILTTLWVCEVEVEEMVRNNENNGSSTQFEHEQCSAGSELGNFGIQIQIKFTKNRLRNPKLKTLWGSFSKLHTVDAEQLPAPIVTHESQTTFFRSLHFGYTRRHDSTERRGDGDGHRSLHLYYNDAVRLLREWL